MALRPEYGLPMAQSNAWDRRVAQSNAWDRRGISDVRYPVGTRTRWLPTWWRRYAVTEPGRPDWHRPTLGNILGSDKITDDPVALRLIVAVAAEEPLQGKGRENRCAN
jgi:hypothetical protein